MKDFAFLKIHKDVPYAMNKYIGYEKLSPKYHAYMQVASSIVEPTIYSEVIKDPRWVEAMNEEIRHWKTIILGHCHTTSMQETYKL